MGFVVGVAVGSGILIILRVLWNPRPLEISQRVRERSRRFIVPSLISAGAVFMVALVASSSLPISAILGSFGGLLPLMWKEHQRRRRAEELREAWPEAIDSVVGALRSGLSVGESLAMLGSRGPEVLRPSFRSFADRIRANGRVGEGIDWLKDDLADPMADRILEAMRIAHELGGRDLASTLAGLATLVREDNRARGELLARQSWTVNGARIAAAAPWIMLLLFSTRPATLAAYSTPLGLGVLMGGAAVTVLAYLLMIKLGTLPDDERIFGREATNV